MRLISALLILGMLAASAHGETPLQVCLDKNNRRTAARVDACRTAAEQGDAKAQVIVGILFYHGYGVPKDYVQAASWFHLAADQGAAEAQTTLGFMYYDGRGVPKNYAEAARWYRLAAEQGVALAQYALGVIYREGQGVPEDWVRAYMWFNLAAVSGSGPGRKERNRLTKLLTPEQLAEAQRMAREWVEKRKGK